eukprot:5963419-Amphidinium_carterae.1
MHQGVVTVSAIPVHCGWMPCVPAVLLSVESQSLAETLKKCKRRCAVLPRRSSKGMQPNLGSSPRASSPKHGFGM